LVYQYTWYTCGHSEIKMYLYLGLDSMVVFQQ
jgi:hypothetical protein